MGISFTADQQKVIELHNRNILVSAAAGSGKTAVLVERIIRMVCDEANPVDIDRLLIVTFTNAAAAEMRERISQGIARQLQLHPESEHIERQAALLHNALITTIDSFCLYLIRNHFHEIRLDPAFRVADEGEVKLLKQDVLAGLLEDYFGAKDPRFLECVEFFCPGGRESVLENIILDFYTFAMSYPWPEKWLMERKADYHIDSVEALEDSNVGIFLKGHLKKMTAGCVLLLQQALQICEQPDGPYMYGALLEKEIEALERLLKCESLTGWEAAVSGISFDRLPTKKDASVSTEKREAAKAIRNDVKDTVKSLQADFFAKPLTASVRQLQESVPYIDMLVDLTFDFMQRLAEKKQEKKILDFNDMEHFALNILIRQEGGKLVPSPVALEYREHFKEILIDEYQDSNLVQEYLLQAISGEDNGRFNRFMVGDVKQSIYKFRLARPELFLEKYDTYSSEESVCQRIDLSRNFRSREEVVDTVNHIFSRIMSQDKGGITYDDKAALYAGASYPENPDCRSELLLVEKPGAEDAGDVKTDGSTGIDLSAKAAEGHMIARRIKELRDSFRVTDKQTGQLRPVKYKDMVILLRTNSGWDEELKAALQEEGIPVYITSKTGYFAAKEVQELLQFLRVLDNPTQDIPLYGVMKSVFGGFTEEEIALLRAGNRKCSLWTAVCDRSVTSDSVKEVNGGTDDSVHRDSIPNVASDTIVRKCSAFRNQIEKYRSYTIYMPIRELLQVIVDDYSYLHYVTAMPAGSKRKANVEMLFTKASDFEKTSYFGLFHFVRYIEQLEKYDVDFGEADMLDENADVVRIMSIHKSKGLEFPVTFVAGLSKKFNMQDTSKAFLMDIDMGVASDYVNLKYRIKDKTIRKTIMARKMKEDNLAEELRVFYVALTRAREKLIMTASVPQAAEKAGQAGSRMETGLSYTDYISAGNYLDMLLPVIDSEKLDIRVYQGDDFQAGQIAEQLGLGQKKEQLLWAKELADEKLLQFLSDRFSFQYSHENLAGLYTKTTVSELKIAAMADKDEAAFHAFEEKEVVPYIPVFKRGQESISATTRGNAYHKVMELLDFEVFFEEVSQVESASQGTNGSKTSNPGVCMLRNDGAELLKAFLDNEVEKGFLTREYREAVSERKLLNFLQDPIAGRMWKAQKCGNLYREQPFVFGISAKRLSDEFPEKEKVLIQGIVDVFFMEDDGIVLVDYKTDRVSSAKELWDRYETQLDYYEEALCKLMKLPVKERILYSFGLEKCVQD